MLCLFTNIFDVLSVYTVHFENIISKFCFFAIMVIIVNFVNCMYIPFLHRKHLNEHKESVLKELLVREEEVEKVRCVQCMVNTIGIFQST